MRVHLPVLLFAWALAGCQWVPQLTPGAVACDDGRTNGAETDVDCGGNCAQCGDGRVCLRDVDCASHVCVASHCAAPSCADGVINGTETDVDCGGGCAPCVDQQRCSVATDCVSGACGDGLCGAGSCSDLAKNGDETDIDCGGHCAPCATGQACVRTADCQSGACADGTCGGAVSCAAPLLDCGSGCVDPRFEHDHCGACGTPCDAAEVCFNGTCFASCTGGLAPCPSGCVDLAANRDNCGACGNPCGADEVCLGGSCIFACPLGQTACQGLCVSTDRDRFNCGGCGVECGPQACVGGMCEASCGPPLLPCDGGLCIDPANDPMNCGGCGIACTAVNNAIPNCETGLCGRGVCLPGFDDCDGQDVNGCEADLGADPSHCGRCGTACNSSDSCLAGRCCGALPSGTYQTSCSGCEACDGVLSCLCNDAAQNPTPASISLQPPCAAGYTNCNGVLLCDGC